MLTKTPKPRRKARKPLDPNEIIAIFNGEPITRHEYNAMVEQAERDMENSIEYGDEPYSDADPGL